MHMVIRALVYAKTKEEALVNAKEVFDRLTENQHPFDYYVTFDQNGLGSAGKDRWGKKPVAVKVNSKEGKKLLEEGLEFTKKEFMDNLKNVRAALIFKEGEAEVDDETLFNERHQFPGLRYPCYCIGQYRGSSVWLYDNDGEGIRDPGHLKDVLNKWDC